jgi:hypothetical protein
LGDISMRFEAAGYSECASNIPGRGGKRPHAKSFGKRHFLGAFRPYPDGNAHFGVEVDLTYNIIKDHILSTPGNVALRWGAPIW